MYFFIRKGFGFWKLRGFFRGSFFFMLRVVFFGVGLVFLVVLGWFIVFFFVYLFVVRVYYVRSFYRKFWEFRGILL